MVEQLARPNTDGTGYASGAVVLMPRQVGKTQTLLAVILARMYLYPGYTAAYAAQTGIVGTHVMTNPETGWITQVEGEPRLAARHRCSRSQGREMIRSTANRGAYLKAFAPIPGRLRSNSLDLVVMDECQEHSRELATALLSSISPVFTTRPRRQLVMVGTAGERGGWWAEQVDTARDAGTLIEVGSWPPDADPADPAVWRAHHPGLMTGLTDEAHLAAELQRHGPDIFAREYGNRFTGAAGPDLAISDPLWNAAAWQGAAPERPAAIAVDVAPDQAAAAIVAAGTVDGRTIAGLVDARPGTQWVVPRLVELHKRHPRAAIAVDQAGPAAAVVDALALLKIRVHIQTAADRTAATAHLVTELDAGRCAVLPHPVFDAARLAAVRRITDTGGWVWSRRRSAGDISPMVALTLAVHAARRPPPARPKVVA